MRFDRLTRTALAAAAGAACLALSACGESSSGPAGPAPPDLTTPRGFLRALADYYSYREADSAVALFSTAYRFYPARPESISFLTAGQTSWDYEQEKAILEELLVPERTTWIDQVLLEIHQVDIRDLGGGRVEYDADVELLLLIGADQFVKARSDVTYTLQTDGEGNYRLLEEHETLPAGGTLSVGELRAEAFEDRITP